VEKGEIHRGKFTQVRGAQGDKSAGYGLVRKQLVSGISTHVSAIELTTTVVTESILKKKEQQGSRRRRVYYRRNK